MRLALIAVRSRAYARALLVAGAMALLLGVSPPPATAAEKSIWGPVTLPDGTPAFRLYRDLDVDVAQMALGFASVAPTRPAKPRDPADPAYQWPQQLDDAVRAGRRYGIEVAILVNTSPRWANGNRGPQWVPRDRAYANFLAAAAKRYPSVRRWMVWGEANRAAVFQPLPPNRPKGPRRYATLLNASYKALKRANRRNVVTGGMTFSFGEVMPRDFLRWMRLPGGKPPPLDEYGHNPFTRRFPNIRLSGFAGFPAARDFSDIDRFAREIERTYAPRYARFRKRGPKLWLSEFAVSTDRTNRSFNFFVSRAEQARWLSAAFRIANRAPYVSGLGWVPFVDEPITVDGGASFGLMTHEGVRKPAYFAFKRAR